MKNHNYSIYVPGNPNKEVLVQAGECTQTIRKDPIVDRPEAGDPITLHGWEARPYRSKWSWRVRSTICQVIPIIIWGDGIHYQSTDTLVPWDRCGPLARRDGFLDAAALKQYFNDTLRPMAFQDGYPAIIVRWWRP